MNDFLPDTIKSVNNRIWQYDYQQEIIDDFKSKLGSENYPDFFIQFFLKRNIAPEEIEDYLNPKLRNHLPDPFEFCDMEKAVMRIVKAIKNQERVFLYSDYDVDGACSASLFINYFRQLNIEVAFYIPSRLKDGYGLHEDALKKLQAEGADLILCTDLGSTTTLTDESLPDIIIIDHHQTARPYPNVYAFIDPMRDDDRCVHKNICATTLTFMCLIALNRALRSDDDFKDLLPNLMDALDLVALATIVDVMPLQGLNRTLVSQGIKIMNQGPNIGLNILNDLTRNGREITHVEDISFRLGPHLNAAGRMGESRLATSLLSTEDEQTAFQIAEKLQKVNQSRMAIQEVGLKDIKNFIDVNQTVKQDSKKFILAHDDDLHIGITGIIASKIKEIYHVPSLIISYDKNNFGTGSARSVKGFDISEVLRKAHSQNILLKAGGHAMAGGFSLMREAQDNFRAFLRDEISKNENQNRFHLKLDGICNIPNLKSYQLQWLEVLGPFGHQNYEPIFAITNLHISYLNFIGVKKNHLQVTFQNLSKETLRAILFNGDNLLGDALVKAHEQQQLIHVAGYLRVNNYKNRKSLQMVILDIAHSQTSS